MSFSGDVVAKVSAMLAADITGAKNVNMLKNVA